VKKLSGILIMAIVLLLTNNCSKHVNSNPIDVISKTDPVITWDPGDMSYGTPLSEDQLNATADVDGTFVYTPPLGTVLNSGSKQQLLVVFTPTDNADYNTVIKIIYINVIDVTANPNVVADINGNVYHTVTIGTQTWMVENLKATKYRSGEPIQNETTLLDWLNATSGAYCWYNDSLQYKKDNGALYNRYAVNNSNGLAPQGWHIASDSEWQTLIDYLGGVAVVGPKLRESGNVHWSTAVSTNSSGFTAIPAGLLDCSANKHKFADMGMQAFWWSSTILDPDENTYWVLAATSVSGDIKNNAGSYLFGFPVRCIKD
jgi:uncharacterized protein (TIGR02145 family)